MPYSVALCVSIIVISARTSVVTGVCTKINSCSCQNNDGTVVDLSPLATSGGNPQFLDVPDQTTSDTFSWNPCNSFNEGTCSGVAVCQTRPAVPQALQFNCGTQDSADFLIDEKGRLMVQYSAESSGALRTTNIALLCDQNTEKNLVVLGEQGALAIYDMELTSKYACPVSPPGSSLSAGSILLIIFFSVLALYLIVGIAFQVGVKKRRGIESIPNSEFWTGLPRTIKAGVMFTIQRGKGKSYDEI